MSGKKKSNGLGSGGGKKKKEYKSNEKQPALGEISHISLDSHQEDQLLELFKALDGIQTLALDPAVTLVSEQPWSPSAGCPDSPSSGSDQSVDEELNNAPDDFGAETLTTAPISSALDTPLEKSDVGCVSSSRPIHSAERKLMVRQMIRDDRRKSIDWRECKSTSKQAKKEFSRTGVLSPLHVSPSVTRRVRVSVVFNGTAKAYVVERSREGLESIYENCRRDFQLDASRDVVLSSEQSQCRVVSEGDLLSCPDGEVVYLLSESAVSANVCSGDDIGPPDCPDGTKPNMEHGIDPAHCWTPRCVDAAISASLLRNLISPAASNSDRSRDKLLLARKNLPIYAMRNDIVRLIRDNAVVVVVGDTGSGKSTQLPQYLLDDAILSGHGSEAFIVCTQPRRLSAISLAERVSEEMQAGSVFEPPPITYLVEGLKDVDDTSDSQFLHPSRRGNSLCGYEVRLKSTLSRNTRVLYCTTGILLRKLQSPEFLNKVSHIILDEVHERQVEMDFLCAVLKARLPAHPALKLILMSATLDENMISAYYASATGPCPTLHIPGRMFPVNIRYLNELPKFFTRWGSIRTRNDISPSKSDNVLSARRLASGGRQYVGLDEATESSAPVPACDSERIVELIRCIINKHFIEHPDDYDPNYKIPSDSCGEAILVFLPGLQDIRRVEMELRKAEFQYWLPCNESIASEISEEVDEDIKERRRRLRTEAAIQIHVLHSSISPEQQRRVFNRTQPGHWKIILSTNIAETGVTVDDVSHVVDTGLVKLIGYDPVCHISTLIEQPISLASARQRAGRAGRTRPGECWRLSGESFWGGDTLASNNAETVTHEPHAGSAIVSGMARLNLDSNRAAERTAPDILRMPLEDVVLRVLQLNLGNPEIFLSTCIDAPEVQSTRLAVSRLVDMGAINPGVPLELSPLGVLMAELPMDALLAKMLIYASVLDCVDAALTVAAFLSGKSPFLMTLHKQDEYFKKFSQFCPKRYPYSDHIAVVNVFSKWWTLMQTEGREAGYQFCRDNFLSFSILEDIAMLRDLFNENLVKAGLVAEVLSTRHGGEAIDTDRLTLLNYCLCAGMYPNVVRVCRMPIKAAAGMKLSKAAQHKTKIHILQEDGKDVSFHPSSLLHRHVLSILNNCKDAHVVFHKKLASTSSIKESTTIHLHDATVVPAVALVVFAPRAFIANNRKRIVVDSWLHMSASELHAVMLLRLNTLVKTYMTSRVANPTSDLTADQHIITTALLALADGGGLVKKLF